MLKIGHRGAAGHLAENTLASFQKALELGVQGIELDIHLSNDKKLMVFHDDTLNRMTNGRGPLSDFAHNELKKLRIDGKYEIPTLEEVLELINKKCFVNIELKGGGTAEPTAKLIRRYVEEKKWEYNHFIVSSFVWDALTQISELNPKIPIGVLTETDMESAFQFARLINAKSIHPDFHLLTKENTSQMQAADFQVFPWTVNEMEHIQKMKSYGVDGIITDFPDRI
jgi:glycerophosphoryl diester phosphodiesterase